MRYTWFFISFSLSPPAHNPSMHGGRENDLKVPPVKRHRQLIPFCTVPGATNYINGYVSLRIVISTC